jgi:hypothetical protein
MRSAPDWITNAGLAVLILWLLVERLVPKILSFASPNRKTDLNGITIDEVRLRLDSHDKELDQIERKLEENNKLLNEINGNVIALQTIIKERRFDKNV